MMRRAITNTARLAAAASVVAALSGCAEMNLFGHLAKRAVSEPPPAGEGIATVYKIGKPYQVKGVWYYPQEDFDYDETGIASWYGPDFHGKLTANGEVFDQNSVSAAHKTLPMPSVVRVTNLENGRSIVVRVNDRGPFAHSRVLDMSRRGAQLLGFENKGTARVRVQILADESRILAGKAGSGDTANEPEIAAAPRGSVSAQTLPPPGSSETSRPVYNASAGNASAVRAAQGAEAVERQLASETVAVEPVRHTGIFVQAGSFSRHDNALRLSARLSSVGRPDIQQVSVKGKTWYRVRFGPFADTQQADRLLEGIIAAGQQDAKVIVD